MKWHKYIPKAYFPTYPAIRQNRRNMAENTVFGIFAIKSCELKT